MAGASDIEWTDATWNPVAGCTMVSPGCTNCYAMRMAARLQAMGLEKYQGTTRKTGGRSVWTGRIRIDEAAWLEKYRQLWDARFDELDKVVEELKQKEKSDGRKKRG